MSVLIFPKVWVKGHLVIDLLVKSFGNIWSLYPHKWMYLYGTCTQVLLGSAANETSTGVSIVKAYPSIVWDHLPSGLFIRCYNGCISRRESWFENRLICS